MSVYSRTPVFVVRTITVFRCWAQWDSAKNVWIVPSQVVPCLTGFTEFRASYWVRPGTVVVGMDDPQVALLVVGDGAWYVTSLFEANDHVENVAWRLDDQQQSINGGTICYLRCSREWFNLRSGLICRNWSFVNVHNPNAEGSLQPVAG